LYGGALCLWVLSAELASHLLSDTQDFGVDPRLMENLCTRGVNIYFERKTTFFYDTSLVLTTDALIVLMSALLND
jgi:hypothetical protein